MEEQGLTFDLADIVDMKKNFPTDVQVLKYILNNVIQPFVCTSLPMVLLDSTN